MRDLHSGLEIKGERVRHRNRFLENTCRRILKLRNKVIVENGSKKIMLERIENNILNGVDVYYSCIIRVLFVRDNRWSERILIFSPEGRKREERTERNWEGEEERLKQQKNLNAWRRSESAAHGEKRPRTSNRCDTGQRRVKWNKKQRTYRRWGEISTESCQSMLNVLHASRWMATFTFRPLQHPKK